jgi:hypothetical protein
MGIGGLVARAVLKQKPTKLCERCGLRYSLDEPACTHCKDIVSESDLAAFKERIQQQKVSGVNLGAIFFVIALAIGLLLFLSF